jgi:hypothetical protein
LCVTAKFAVDWQLGSIASIHDGPVQVRFTLADFVAKVVCTGLEKFSGL